MNAHIISKLEQTVIAFIKACALKQKQSLVTLRQAYIASLSHDLLRSDLLLTKRDIYYLCRTLFPNVSSVNYTVSILSRSLCVTANNLNIVAAPKGLITGPLSYIGEHNEFVYVTLFGPNGVLVPSRPERLRQISTSASLILVVEKETAFDYIVGDRNFAHICSTWIVATGKGYPDHATRNILKAILTQHRLPVFIITDADPHGISIAACYARALQSTDLHWIGIHPSQCNLLFKVADTDKIPLTANERKMAQNLFKECKQYVPMSTFCVDVCREIYAILEQGWKFELEAIQPLGPATGLNSNPLLDYITNMISSRHR